MFGIQNKTALTIFIFGIAEFSGGLAMALMPQMHADLLNLADGSAALLRVIGVMAMAFGYYYIRFGLVEDQNFARFSVQVRFGLTAFWLVAVALGALPMGFIAVAVYDTLGAAWTALALRREPATA